VGALVQYSLYTQYFWLEKKRYLTKPLLTKVNHRCEYVESVKEGERGGKIYVCEKRVESWQCPGVSSKLRICVNSFNKRANPRHRKTDRERERQKERKRAGGGVLLFACYIQQHLINLPCTHHNTHNTPQGVCYSLLSHVIPSLSSLKVPSLPVSKSVIFCLSHTLSFHAVLLSPLARQIFFFSSESLSDFVLMNPLWVHLDIQCVTLLSEDVMSDRQISQEVFLSLTLTFPKATVALSVRTIGICKCLFIRQPKAKANCCVISIYSQKG